MKYARFVALGLLLFSPGFARQIRSVCGTHRDNVKEELHLHRRTRLKREAVLRRLGLSAIPSAAPGVPAGKDIGNIAVLSDADGVVARLNEFNLLMRTVTFRPQNAAASRYKFDTGESSYDAAAANAGTRVDGLTDDDFRQMALPFPFPLFGVTFRTVFVNSDGSLTFGEGDNSSSERSLGRLTAGPPRIAALYRDLDPSMSSQGVRVLSEPNRFIVSWDQVPEYRDVGTGPLQSFQIRLYPDGRIEFAYGGISTAGAVVGISPGRLQGASAIVTFLEGSATEYSSTIAERFGGDLELDLVMATQKFYELHDDSYDFVVIFNNLSIRDGPSSIASERTVRTFRQGIGDPAVDVGRDWGSAARLQAVLNMGPLEQYGALDSFVSGRELSRDTPLTILAHEAGHLFLAYASVRDSTNTRPMLGFQGAHWSFNFNSEASLLEGTRIRDNGVGASPRFTTVAVTEGYSPLDQYLMGLRAPEEVPPTFYVSGSRMPSLTGPRIGVNFDGERRDVHVEQLIQAEGRRVPDHTVAQRRYRFAFILISPDGADPTAEQLEKLERFRTEFEAYFAKATAGRATADTSLRRKLQLSVFPAGGVLMGRPATAAIRLAKAAESPIVVALSARNGVARTPATVTVPAGQTSATFTITGLREGVEELLAEPSDARYETSEARIQVAATAANLTLAVVSGANQPSAGATALPEPVVLRVVDRNLTPYPGVTVEVQVSAGGSVSPASAVTDENGSVSLRWTTAAGALNEMTARIAGAPAASALTVSALGAPAVTAAGIVNAASYRAGLSPGSLASIFGVNLSAGTTAAASTLPWPTRMNGVQVAINGQPAPLLMVSDRQINFLAPLYTPVGDASIVVSTPLGVSTAVTLPVSPTGPGIFFNTATNMGAILVAGTSATTDMRPVAPGEYIEIYATGLGTVHPTPRGLNETDVTPMVFVGRTEAPVLVSCLAPGFVGLYQVNVQIPAGVAPGLQPVSIAVNGQTSNDVQIRVR